jgi:hypothetical protein
MLPNRAAPAQFLAEAVPIHGMAPDLTETTPATQNCGKAGSIGTIVCAIPRPGAICGRITARL